MATQPGCGAPPSEIARRKRAQAGRLPTLTPDRFLFEFDKFTTGARVLSMYAAEVRQESVLAITVQTKAGVKQHFAAASDMEFWRTVINNHREVAA